MKKIKYLVSGLVLLVLILTASSYGISCYFFSKAQAAFEEGNYYQTWELSHKSKSFFPFFTGKQDSLIGRAYFQSEMKEDARIYLEGSLEKGYRDRDMLVNLARIYYDKAYFAPESLQYEYGKKAVSLLEEANEISPGALEYYQIGYTYFSIPALGEGGECAPYFRKAYQMDPDHWLTNLGMCYLYGSERDKRDSLEKAIEHATKSIEIRPTALAHNCRGTAFHKLDEYYSERVIQDWLQATSLNPDYFSPYYNLGLAYSEIEEFQLALYFWEEALRTDTRGWENFIMKKIDEAEEKIFKSLNQ